MSQVQRLAVLLERVSGIVLPEREMSRLEALGRERAGLNGFQDFASYIQALRRDPESNEWRELLSRVTVKESSLFRGSRQFEVLVEGVIPSLLSGGRRTLRIWSAGCARGEETATLAVVLANSDNLCSANWEVLGTDVDEEALAVAARGMFSRRAVRKVPRNLLDRFFRPRGDQFELVPELRSRIKFRFLNLVSTPYTEFDSQPPFDIVLLRNVLIYFRQESQIRVLAEVAERLAPNGALFVGPSESLWQISPQFVAEDLGGCFVHRKRAVPEYGRSGDPAKPSLKKGKGTSPKYATASAQATAGGRIGKIQQPPTSVGDASGRRLGSRQRGRDDPSRGFADRPGRKPGPPRTLTSPTAETGDWRGREDGLAVHSDSRLEDPAVYVLVGFGAEKDGRFEDALKAFRAAAYLEPRYFQVRFLMARCLERSGWLRRARAEFRAVLTLLESGSELELAEVGPVDLPSRMEVEDECRRALLISSESKGPDGTV